MQISDSTMKVILASTRAPIIKGLFMRTLKEIRTLPEPPSKMVWK
jgi:hypothetical protein